MEAEAADSEYVATAAATAAAATAKPVQARSRDTFVRTFMLNLVLNWQERFSVAQSSVPTDI